MLHQCRDTDEATRQYGTAALFRSHAPFIDGLLDELFDGRLRFSLLPKDLLREYIGPMVLYPYRVVACASNGNRLIRWRDQSIICGMAVGDTVQIASDNDFYYVEIGGRIMRRSAIGLTICTLLAPDFHIVPQHRYEKPLSYHYLPHFISISDGNYWRSILKSPGSFKHVVSHNREATVLWDGNRLLKWQRGESSPLVTLLDRAPVAVHGSYVPALVHTAYASGEIELLRLFE